MIQDGPSPRRLAASLVGLSYLFAGMVWILFSDEVGKLLFLTEEANERYQTYKGTGFVVVTAAFVYLLAARRWRPPQPLKGGIGIGPLLTGVVLVTAGPLFALLAFNVTREAELGVTAANEAIHREADSTAADALSFFNQQQRLAQVLAHQVQTGMWAGHECSALLADILRVQQALRNIVVLDARRSVVCAARQDGPVAPVPPGALTQRKPLLTSPARFPDRATFALTYATQTGSNGGAVQLVLDAASLSPLVRARLPDGSAAALMSAEGDLLARWPHLPEAVGTRLATPFRPAETIARGQRAVTGPGPDGVERFYAVREVGNTGLYAMAGVSIESTYAPVRQHAMRSAAVSLAVLALAGILVISIVRRITAPMHALSETASRVAAGERDTRAPEVGPAEIASVATQFNRMLDRLPELENELRESEDLNKQMLDKLSSNIPGLMFVFCMDETGHGWLPFASDAVTPMFEVTPEAAAQDMACIMARVHPEDAAGAQAAILESMRSLTQLMLEYRVVLPQAGLRYYLTRAQPERRDGLVVWYGCTIDVTPLEEAQAGLRQAKEQLEERVVARTRELASANEALESFSYSVAHDLRAPLQAIEGFSGAIPAAIERGDRDRADHLARRIAANTQRTTTMINALLDIARASNVALQERPVTLDAMVRDVVAELDLPAQAVFEAGALPRVVADPASLRQVWWNLIANAAKFSAGRAQPRIEVGCERRGDEIAFFVRDNGAGFDPSFTDRLFVTFQRLHDANEFEGSGIGLALVRRIVERHGGRTWAEGEPDRGACFWFTLPATRLVER